MEELLKEILSRDKSILARRDDLIKILDEEVPNNQRRTYAAIRKALTLNVGEIFLVSDFSDWEKQERARQILKESGMQDAKIDDVINTFANALKFDVPQKKVPSQFEILEEKILKLENQIAAKEPDKTATQSTEIKIFQYKILKLENQFSEFKTLKEKFAKLEENLNTQLKKYNLEEKITVPEDSLEKAKNAWLILNQKLLERVQKLEIKNENLENKIAVLEKEIASLNIENDFMQMRLARLTNDSNKTPPKNSTAPKEIKPACVEDFSAQIETPPPANPHINLRQKLKPVYTPRTQRATNTINTPKNISADEDFIKEYNHLMNKTGGFEKSNARKDFIAKYKVKYFNCVNYNERMNQPKLPPIFEESSASGDYWAIPTAGNVFKVVPNAKSYNDNYHGMRAMGEVFDSNFSGGKYSNIQVEKAAEFTNSEENWTLIKKGKLVLR